jgi:hypothetical protein
MIVRGDNCKVGGGVRPSQSLSPIPRLTRSISGPERLPTRAEGCGLKRSGLARSDQHRETIDAEGLLAVERSHEHVDAKIPTVRIEQ